MRKAWRRRDKSPPLQELTSRKLKRKGQKTIMHPRDGENMCSFLMCPLLLMEDITGTYLLRGPGEKSGLRLNFSIQSPTGKSTLESKYHPGAQCSPQSQTTLWHLCSGEAQRMNGGTCRHVGEFRCKTDVLLCRQDRWNLTALVTTIYPIWQKLHLSNPSYMAPEVASPRSKPNL